MERREFLGAVEETSLASNISNSDTTISLVDGSSYPTGSSNPFVIVVNRGRNIEEKILCSSRVLNTLTVVQRGYDGTQASAHLSGDKVDHVLDATSVQSFSNAAFDGIVLLWSGLGG